MSTTRTLCWLCALLTGLLVFSAWIPNRAHAGTATTADGRQVEDDGKYDVLDGKGLSGKKVDVITWEGNLEIHVAPKGSLKGLALKLDLRDKNKPVMVIGYRFVETPKTQLIRRALVEVPLVEGFKSYLDPTVPDYDKIVITNSNLSSPLVAYQLEPPPTQLYPDAPQPSKKSQATAATLVPSVATTADSDDSAPNHRTPATALKKQEQARKDAAALQESGTIRPFFSDPPSSADE